MSEQNKGPQPTEINLHRKSRLLNIRFSDGQSFSLPCEYLRVNSHAAEVTSRNIPEIGKEDVNIDRIEPQGTYAVRIVFDDGHDTGIYSWETLYDLGLNREKYWQQYLDRLEAAGYARDGRRMAGAADAERKIRVMYFAYLANKMGKESEDLTPPDTVEDVRQLLGWLRRVKGERRDRARHRQQTVCRALHPPRPGRRSGDRAELAAPAGTSGTGEKAFRRLVGGQS